MIQISRLSDYAVIILGVIGQDLTDCHSATSIAARVSLAPTTVSKCLKLLTAAGLLLSVRGPKGGYRLAQPLSEMSLLAVIESIEGKVQLTECVSDDSHCCLQDQCELRPNWHGVNQQVAQLLASISVKQMMSKQVEYPIHFHDPAPSVVEIIGETVHES